MSIFTKSRPGARLFPRATQEIRSRLQTGWDRLHLLHIAAPIGLLAVLHIADRIAAGLAS